MIDKKVDNNDKAFYNCPDCGRGEWVFKVAPWRGCCSSCISKKNPLEKAVAGI